MKLISKHGRQAVLF